MQNTAVSRADNRDAVIRPLHRATFVITRVQRAVLDSVERSELVGNFLVRIQVDPDRHVDLGGNKFKKGKSLTHALRKKKATLIM